jgi:hypothetical protein
MPCHSGPTPEITLSFEFRLLIFLHWILTNFRLFSVN